jgi:predicted kinase
MGHAIRRPTLLLMAGLPGAGKTTLALALRHALGWPAIDKDALKSPLVVAGIPNEVAGPTAYELLFAVGRDILVRQRRSVILDSPALYAICIEQAQRIAAEGDADLKVILCLADSSVRNARMAARQPLPSQPGSDPASTLDQDRARFTHLPADTCTLDSARPLSMLVEAALAYLRVPADGRDCTLRRR